jgi:hypothetical protein
MIENKCFPCHAESKKGKGNLNKQFGTPDILVHTGSPKKKANLFLPSFIMITSNYFAFKIYKNDD